MNLISLRALLALTILGAQQAQPTFRSGVELIRLDVSVVDKDGVPVRDLRAEDFIVKVDGAARLVSFARFYGPEAGAPAQLPNLPRPASFASNVGAPRGRVLVIAVDVESMEPGYEKPLLDSVSKLVDELGPNDSAALIPIPGKTIDLTRDHQRVKEALQRLRGWRTPSEINKHVIAVREAEAIERGNTKELAEVITRECGPTERDCPREIAREEVPALLRESDRRISNVLHTMSDLNHQLATVDAPGTVLLISAGLPYRTAQHALFSELRETARASGTRTYVVQMEQPDFDVSRPSRAGLDGGPTRDDRVEGLLNIAGFSGGTFKSAVGPAPGVLDRIRSEILHTYQLGVESTAADADGKVHTVDVQVRRAGLTVNARKEIVVSKTPRKPLTVMDALNEPTGLSELPMTTTAYGAQSESPGELKVVLLVETHASAETYAIRISGGERPPFQASDPLAPAAPGARAVLAATLPPGRYVLRAAAVDASGRAGSVDLPLTLELHPAGTLKASDLFVGMTAGQRFAPTNYIAPGSAVTALLELYAATPDDYGGATVDLEVRAAGSSTAVASGTTHLNETGSATRRIAQGSIERGALPAGTYVLSALVRKQGEVVATVRRDFVWQ